MDAAVLMTVRQCFLAKTPEESSSVPDDPDPSAHDSSTSDSGGPELRFDDHPDDHGLYTWDEFLENYGDADGAARWERAPKQRFDDSPPADDAAPRDTRPDHGTPSGGSGGARADAGGRRDGAASANGSGAVTSSADRQHFTV